MFKRFITVNLRVTLSNLEEIWVNLDRKKLPGKAGMFQRFITVNLRVTRSNLEEIWVNLDRKTAW